MNARINIFTQLATCGVAPDPDDVVSIVEAAAEAGVYDEAYRAIVNFIWSASGYLPLDRIELVVAEARGRLARCSSAQVDRPLPRGLHRHADPGPVGSVDRGRRCARPLGAADMSVAMRLVFLTVAGGLALRRGEVEAARPLLEELRPLALASGEPQRIIPMACVTLPWLVVTGELEELRSLTEEISGHARSSGRRAPHAARRTSAGRSR